MEFRLLGPLEVSGGAGALALGGAKQRGLLAILVLHANQAVSRERLIDGLWGDAPPRTVATELNVYVSKLRKLLRATGGSAVLRTCPGGYVLELADEDVDVRRFERLVVAGRARLSQGEPREAAAKLREALALWRGPPLLDVAELPFARVEISLLEERRVAALEDRLEAELRLGRHAEVIGELQCLVAEHPHRDRLRARLMLALYRAGRQADALQAYREGRRLAQELGMRPGAELRRLELAILRQDPELDLDGQGIEARRHRASAAELHERFAAWLEERGESASPVWEELLAHHLEAAFDHYEQAGATERSAPLGQRAALLHARAGRRALDRGDVRAGTGFLGRALALPQNGNGRTPRLGADLGDALLARGDLAGAYAVLSEASDLASPDDPLLRARLRLLTSYVRAHSDPAERRRLRAVAEDALDVFTELSDAAGRSRALSVIADSSIAPADAIAAAELARDAAARMGNRRLQADATFIACKQTALGGAGAAEIVAMLETTLASARLDGDEGLAARLLCFQGLFTALQGCFADGRRLFAEGRNAMAVLGLDLAAATCGSLAARIELLAGAADAAEREARAALAELRAMGETGAAGSVAACLARALCEQGRAAEALPYAEDAARQAFEDDVIEQVDWRIARALALSSLGQHAEAVSLADDAVERAARGEVTSAEADAALALAQVHTAAGSGHSSRNTADRARRLYEQKGDVVSAGRAAAVASA